MKKTLFRTTIWMTISVSIVLPLLSKTTLATNYPRNFFDEWDENPDNDGAPRLRIGVQESEQPQRTLQTPVQRKNTVIAFIRNFIRDLLSSHLSKSKK